MIRQAKRRITTSAALALLAVALTASPVGADVIQSRGEGQHFYVSWTEYDPDDVLGLPGNVHVGYLSGWMDQYGTYFYGNVTDFDCDPGETPWGGHGVAEAIAAEADELAEETVEDTVDAIVESGASVIDPEVVVDAVKGTLADEVPATIEQEVQDEVPACDWIQDRFLDGAGTASFTVANQTVTVTGTLTVTGGHGGHGDPGPILGQPPINLTLTGGEWQGYDWSYSYWGADYKYTNAQRGTDYYGSTVSGAIGAMGFDDDPDDESYGGFGSFQWRTVERIRS